MNKEESIRESFNEQQLLKTLKTAIATSKRTLMNDGLLLIYWGLAFSMGFLWNYYTSIVLVPSRIRDLFHILKPVIGIALIAYTIYFVFFKGKKIKTYTAISTRFVWIGIIIAHNLVIMVTKSVITEINFDLLHPLQMILIGFALFVTGGIYRYYILSYSGILMWIAAIISAKFDLNTQFLIRGIADFLCFVVPGILMFMKVKTERDV